MRLDRRRLSRLEIALRRKLNRLEPGLYYGYYGVEGFDFRGVRQYQFGDQLGRIDWHRTEVMGELMVWEAEPEVAVNSGIVFDMSPSMFYGTEGEQAEKMDVAIVVAAAVFELGSHHGNQVGSLFASGEVTGMKLGAGEGHRRRLFGYASSAKPEDGTPSEFVEALELYPRRFRQRGIAVVISDFLHGDWDDALRRVARKHDTLCVRVIDRREMELEPAGVRRFVDPVTGEAGWRNTNNRKRRKQYATDAENERVEIKRRIIASGADYIELRTEGDLNVWLEEFIRRLNQRNRRIRQGRGRRIA